MHPFGYRIRLRLRHPKMDPDSISSALEMQPSHTSKAGQQRMTPEGKLLRGVYRETRWSTLFAEGGGFDLVETLTSHLTELEKRKTFLAELYSTGGHIEIDIAWFTGEKNTGQIFDWELLKRLAALKIDLGFDVYGGPDPGQEALETALETER